MAIEMKGPSLQLVPLCPLPSTTRLAALSSIQGPGFNQQPVGCEGVLSCRGSGSKGRGARTSPAVQALRVEDDPAFFVRPQEPPAFRRFAAAVEEAATAMPAASGPVMAIKVAGPQERHARMQLRERQQDLLDVERLPADQE
jgi:hypothetical protein